MKELEIFTKSTCGWAERLYSALDAKAIAYRIVPSCDRLGRKTREFLALSPYARTPTIRYGDLVLYESALINDFVEEQFPDRPLLPRDPGARAKDRLWIYHCDHVLMPALTQLLAAQGSVAKELAGNRLDTALRQIVDWGFRAAPPAPFWRGADIGLVDIAYQTFFQAVRYVQGMKDGPDIALDLPLETWQGAIAGHPCIRKAHDVAQAVPYADEAETR